jgi:uncharacterized protein (TIGR03435 family)
MAPGLDLRGIRAGRLVIRATPLRDLIGFAYPEVVTWHQQLIGGAPRVMSAHFDIEARFEPSATGPARVGELPERLVLMLRALLEDRFGLRAHVEQRDLRVFALVLARPDGRLGPNLKPSTTKCPPTAAERSAPVGDAPPCELWSWKGTWKGNGVSITTLTGILGQQPEVKIPVHDETGLTGLFDLTLELGPIGDSVSVFTALEEQLGLKLIAQSRKSDVLVVDHVELPTPN